MTPVNPKYDFKKIEAKWAKKWAAKKIYTTPRAVSRNKKLYVLPQLPYPSGAGLHVGHAEVYTACDIYARFQRMQGKKVLQAIGWDAFGLPAENYAIKTGVHPKITINKAIDNFRDQIKRMGVSVDWQREVGSHNPDYYRWTQWFFLLMYQQGLAYRAQQSVNWCKSCKTVLANEQVQEGYCERCRTPVVQRQMQQWFLRITRYAEQLHQDLDKVDWPEESIRRQRDWIGKSQGALIEFPLSADRLKLAVFTTRPDTLYGATFLVLAPEHPLANQLKNQVKNLSAVAKYIQQTRLKTELERKQHISDSVKTGVRLEGVWAANPASQAQVPIFLADYVLMTYGTGSIMGVPAHDQRDFEFAQQHNLSIKPVIQAGAQKQAGQPQPQVYDGPGAIINSPLFTKLTYPRDQKQVIEILAQQKIGQAQTVYRLRDWSVSRQRFWGAPIPIVYDPQGQPHPVAKDDLPVKLPHDVDFKPTGESPLLYSKEFQKGVEEKYGPGWRREVDTLDTFMCSSWYYFRYLDPKNKKEFASKKALQTWMPVDFYLGGPEHVTGHLLYSRFFTKVLFDAGIIDFDEPFAKHRHQGMILGEDGRKMSKRWNNIINPTDVMNRHGADTLRLYEMFLGPLEDTKVWNTRGEVGVFRFLSKVWNLQSRVRKIKPSEEQEEWINRVVGKVERDVENLSFNTAIAYLMEFSNFLRQEKKVSSSVWEKFLRVSAPFAPYLAEELWHQLGKPFSIHQQSWPKVQPKYLRENLVTLAVQVNGKTRGLIQVKPDTSQNTAVKLARTNPKISRHLRPNYQKIIFVKNKVLNFVVKH